MPTSRPFPIPYICEKIRLLKPKSILDIGIGFGKYGFLAREYTDIFWQRHVPASWTTRIDGIEIYEPYITPAHRYIYDNIYIGDATELIKTVGVYHMIICSDMLEHLEKSKGLEFLKSCREHARLSLLVIPINPGRRPGNKENPHEAHVSCWTREELNEFGNVSIVGELQYILEMRQGQ